MKGAAWKAADEDRKTSLAKRNRNSMASRATCVECGGRGGVRLRERLCPQSLRVTERMLVCLPCGKRLGFYSPFPEVTG